MGLTTTQDLLAQAKERATARCERLLKAANGSCEPGALAAVLHELGAIWRDEADKLVSDNKKGAKGASLAMRDAATRVIAVAQDLERYGAELGPTHSATLKHMDSGKVLDTLRAGSNQAHMKVEWRETDVTAEFLDAVGHCGARELISGAVCTKPKHDKATSHHGNGITWPWENEPEPSGETVTLPLPLTIGAADAPPAWAAEPVLDVIPLTAPHAKAFPDHLSVSSLELLLSCPLKWRLHYLHGVPRRPSWATIGGSAVHACIKYFELIPGARDKTPEQVRALFRDAIQAEVMRVHAETVFPLGTWQVPAGGKEGREFWEHDGPEMLHRYLEWRKEWSAQGWELLRGHNGDPVVEYEFHLLLPGTGVPLKGFIDSAWRNTHTGDIAVIDPKSGRSLPSDVFQLAVYAAALEHAGAVPTSGRWLGAYWSARDGALTPLVDLTTRCPREELAYRINNAVAQISAGAFAPNTNGNYGGCGSCDAKLSCPVGSRRNAGQVA